MENAHLFGNNELKDKCISFILQNPLPVFRAEDLGELCDECFVSIIGDDKLPVAEDEVFEAVIQYAHAKCPNGNRIPSDETLREKVKNVITKVRFPLMDQQYFSDYVEPRNLLTDNQVLQLYRYFVKKQPNVCPDFNTKKRKCQYTVQRFSDVVSGWGYKRDNRDAIAFTSSKDILMNGVQVYGSDQSSAELDVYIHVKQPPYGAVVAVQRFLIETDGKQKTYKLLFERPPELKKDIKYTIEAVIRGASTYYGSSGQEIYQTDKVTFKFEDTPRSTNNSCVKRGQIPAIVYELVDDVEQENMESAH